MRIVVVGAGMYVTGRGTAGFGTVLPALVQLSKEIEVDDIVVCSTTEAGRDDVERAAESLNRRLTASVKIRHGVVDEVLTPGSRRATFDCAIVSVPRSSPSRGWAPSARSRPSLLDGQAVHPLYE
jgi:hypothetical protein